jgi:F-type H+-transporting ATPase subunit b
MLLEADVRYLDVISVNFWQMLISLANLLILFLILKHFLFRPVQRILARRGEEVAQIYTDAETAKSEAESARAEYSARLEGADAEAEEILRRAGARANERSEEIIAEARAEADVLRRRAAEEIAQEKKNAINEIKDDISDLSLEIAEQIVAREVRPEDHRALVDRFIGELGEPSHE